MNETKNKTSNGGGGGVGIGGNGIGSSSARPTFFYTASSDADFEDFDDGNKVIEESPSGRWSKLDSEIFVQRLSDFDTTHLAIDTDKGFEIAWNEMKFVKQPPQQQQQQQSQQQNTTTTTSNATTRNLNANRFDSVRTLESIYEKLRPILRFLTRLDHSNLLKFFDYWYVENACEAKLVVITEYSSAGSLRKLLDNSRASLLRVKPQTCKRWLNQVLYSVRYLHTQCACSIFQGHLNTEAIFIQNSGVIKLAPTLLSLAGVCDMTTTPLPHGLIRECSSSSAPVSSVSSLELIKLTDHIMVRDLHAVGRLAVEMFTSHIGSMSGTGSLSASASAAASPSSPSCRSRFGASQSGSGSAALGVFDMLLASMLADEAATAAAAETTTTAGAGAAGAAAAAAAYDDDKTERLLRMLHALHCFDGVDEWQRDFVAQCFRAGSTHAPHEQPVTTESLWLHPFVNDIYSLKVLSVFSILTHFHEKHNKHRQRQHNNNNSKGEQQQQQQQQSRKRSIVAINYSPAILISNSRTTGANNNINNNNNNSGINEFAPPIVVNSQGADLNNAPQPPPRKSLTANSSFSQLKLHALSDRRKVSLTFLTNYQHLKIPQHFFGILEDIRNGLYPRLFRMMPPKEMLDHNNNNNNNSNSNNISTTPNTTTATGNHENYDNTVLIDQNDESSLHSLRQISSSCCLDFVMQQKQIIDRRSSLSTFNNLLNELDSVALNINTVRRTSPPALSSNVSSFEQLLSVRAIDSSSLSSASYVPVHHTALTLRRNSSNQSLSSGGGGGGGGNAMLEMLENLAKLPIETRRLAAESCTIRISEADPKLIELSLSLRFNDSLTRALKCHFPIEFINYLRVDYYDYCELTAAAAAAATLATATVTTPTATLGDNNNNNNNSSSSSSNFGADLNDLLNTNESAYDVKLENICTHLANELIDNGLINPKDHSLIVELLLRTIKEHLSYL